MEKIGRKRRGRWRSGIKGGKRVGVAGEEKDDGKEFGPEHKNLRGNSGTV